MKHERTIKAGNETMTVSGHDPVPESEFAKEWEAAEAEEKAKVDDHREDVDGYRKRQNNMKHGSYRG